MQTMTVHRPPALLRQDEAGIAVLTLNRPAQRNALSDGLIAELTVAFEQIARDAAIRSVILAANGPAFCAGHDLKEMTGHRADPDRGRSYFANLLSRCARLMTHIARSPKPVIAAVEGVATAAGCQIVATCDLAIAGAEANFSTPGVQIGLFCSTPMVALSRAIAPKHAMEMLLTGATIDASEAARIGLVNRVVPAGKALAHALELARSIASKSGHSLRVGKEAFQNQREMSLDDAYAYAVSIMTENMLAADAEEGIGAFIEKRVPIWPSG